jgi:hypothetical protein
MNKHLYRTSSSSPRFCHGATQNIGMVFRDPEMRNLMENSLNVVGKPLEISCACRFWKVDATRFTSGISLLLPTLLQPNAHALYK